MSLKSKTFWILAALTVAALLFTNPAEGNGGAAGFSTDVQIAKSEKSVGAYAIRVQVRDLATGQLVAAPQILARGGDLAEVESELPDGASCKVVATIDLGARTATYSVVVTRGGTPIAEHKAKVTIE